MGGGDTTTTTASDIPEIYKPYALDYMGRALATSNLPYETYQGSRTADFNPVQYGAMDATLNRAASGNAATNAGEQQVANTAAGAYMGYQAPQNQYMGAYNPAAGVFNSQAGAYNPNANNLNQFAGTQNPYFGSNPYLDNAIRSSTEDVVKGYNQTIVPQLDMMEARSGSFGNSGVDQMRANAASDLTENIGKMSQGMRFQDYTTQQGLGEAAVNRLYGAGQQQVGNQYGAGQQYANQLYGAGSQQAGNLYGAGQQYANQLYSGGEALAGRQQNAYDAERNRMLSASGISPTFANQDWTDISKMSDVGGQLQDQSQKYIDQNYADWFGAQQYPLQQLNTMGQGMGAYAGAKTTTQTTPNPSFLGLK